MGVWPTIVQQAGVLADLEDLNAGEVAPDEHVVAGHRGTRMAEEHHTQHGDDDGTQGEQ